MVYRSVKSDGQISPVLLNILQLIISGHSSIPKLEYVFISTENLISVNKLRTVPVDLESFCNAHNMDYVGIHLVRKLCMECERTLSHMESLEVQQHQQHNRKKAVVSRRV
jgi:hypothetical protein